MENFISFIVSPPSHPILLVIQILFLGISLFFIGFVIFSFFKTKWFRKYMGWDFLEISRRRPYQVSKKITKAWDRITKRLGMGLEPEYKLAVIEADNMLEEILKKMGYGGKNLEEILTKLDRNILSNLGEVKEIREVRNNIINNSEYKITLEETKRVLDVYEQTFRNLRVL
ncbi:hypothetical protein KKB68_00770 [Patescibacteria group bacterium]|nr:hypothetical protein [Patescibacteria group bacterium]